VQVEIFHRDDLEITASGGATFNTKCGALGRLADDGDDLFAEVRSSAWLKPTVVSGLTLPKRRRGNGVTSIYLPSALSFSRSRISSFTWPLCSPIAPALFRQDTNFLGNLE